MPPGNLNIHDICIWKFGECVKLFYFDDRVNTTTTYFIKIPEKYPVVFQVHDAIFMLF